ncbi:MAG: hypothetical protein IPP26_15880 [Flavobacteriales bacterium]|nr:hypothetical protein [Flavobacteriales bacterium]
MSAPLGRGHSAFSPPVRALILSLSLLLTLGAHAQLLDSIGMFLQEKPRLTVGLDSRGSFISNQNVRMLGVKVGLEHGGRVRYGIGYSFLRTPVEREQQVVENGLTRTVTTRVRLGYVTPFFSYAFYQRGPWEVSIPVQVGIGGGSLVYDDLEGRTQKLKRAFVFLYEPAMTVQYRFLKYFAVGGGLGYRLAFTNASLDESLNAPVYILGVRVFFGDVYKDLRGEEE